MTENTFGMTVRAARLGYHAVPRVGFVRIRAGTGSPPHQIDVVPFHRVPVSRGKYQDSPEYRVWWSDRFSVEIVCETVRRHVHSPVQKAITLYLDDDGNRMTVSS